MAEDQASTQYGTWAERGTPPQVMWEKRVPQNEPEVLDRVMRMFSASGPLQKNLHTSESHLKTAQSMMNKGEYIPPRNSDISLNVYRTVKDKYSNLFVSTATGINEHATNFLPAGAKAAAGIVQSPAAKFVDAFQPISTFVGTTLHTMPGMAQSNLHQGVCSSVGGMLARINPRLKHDIMSAQSALKLDELSHLPSQIMASVRHVASAVNKLLEAPAHIIHDLFSGAISAVQKMSALVNGVFKNLQNLAQKAVGMLTGMLSGITQGIVGSLMSAVGNLAGKISGMMGGFSGLSMLTNFSNGLLGKLSGNLLNGVNLKNPLDISNKLFNNPAMGMMRGFSLNNPMAMRDKLIPPSIGGNMDKVLGKASSFGMVGNHGFGLAKSMDSVKSGVLASVLKQFSSQAGILSHVFSGQEPPAQSFIVGNKPTKGYDGTNYHTDISKQVQRQLPPTFIIPHN